MAQTGFTSIQLYSTSTAAAAPVAGNLTNSTLGSELAINITDGKLFYKDNANAVQVIGWKTVPTTAGGTGLTTYTAGDLSYYASGTTFTKLAIGTNGQILTSTGAAPQWTTLSGVAVTTFSAGTTGFTPNSATSGAVTLAGTLITSNGGTGISSYTAGDLSYYASGTALTKLAIGATGRFLSSTGSAPQWSAPAALTETDDTNVTMTLGGTPSTALLSSVSMTLGWTGQLAVGRGGTGTGTTFTPGSVIFAGTSGVYSQDNAGLFFDSASNKLAINTATVGSTLTVAGDGSFNLSNTSATTPLLIENDNTTGVVTAKLAWRNNGGVKCSINAAVFGNGYMDFSVNADTFAQRIHASTGVSIGNTTDPGAGNLQVNGGIRINGNSTASGLTIANLSSPTSNNTVNSTTYNVTLPTSAKVFWVSAGSGDGVLVVTNYITSTISIVGTSSVIVASSTPASNQLGIYKSVNSHVVSFVTGSAATSTYGSWQIMSLSSTVS